MDAPTNGFGPRIAALERRTDNHAERLRNLEQKEAADAVLTNNIKEDVAEIKGTLGWLAKTTGALGLGVIIQIIIQLAVKG